MIVVKRDGVVLGYIPSVYWCEFLWTGSGDGHEVRHYGDGLSRGSVEWPSSHFFALFTGYRKMFWQQIEYRMQVSSVIALSARSGGRCRRNNIVGVLCSLFLDPVLIA